MLDSFLPRIFSLKINPAKNVPIIKCNPAKSAVIDSVIATTIRIPKIASFVLALAKKFSSLWGNQRLILYTANARNVIPTK